ncbi:putative inorganic phosphate cotransporter isoform X3 [Drosophila innubila]|uniref:putative inorganic phosphate cotransporter isoform X3 n=1 Tax=Drosophila innubila TaxID=198719 RepID=UPI00148D4251|nr:putative inorganic phosphate cotransporter isoform X3 [Drosophila innubila]
MSENIQKVNNRRFEDEGSGLGERHVQMLLLFFGLMVAFAMRVNLSVAIVAMTELPEYNWSEQTKSLVLSSFFWGYVLTQVPAGVLARKFGAKATILTGLSTCSMLNLFTPMCAKLGGWQLLCAVRLLEGVCQGVLYPSYHTLISGWVPPRERASLGTYAYVGAQFGTITMLASSGMLASMAGWSSIFYISGGAGCVWVAAYFQRGASSPGVSSCISDEERTLIELTQASEVATKSEQPKEDIPTPWMSFLTSPPFLALIATHCASNWGFWTLLTQIPSYMKNVLGKDIKANALLSSLPYVVMLVLSLFFVWVSKILQKKDSLSLSFSRKTFNTVGQYIPMILLVALGYVPHDQDILAVVILSLTIGISAAAQLGFMINHIDLSPNFAGVLMGISNGIANIMSIIGPLLVGIIVTDKQNANQWRLVFFIAAGFYLVGNGLFVIFGRANIQDWNDPTAKTQRSSTHKLESQEKTEEA